MSSRVLTDSDRQRRIAERRLQTVASQHSAVGVIARQARAGMLDTERALSIICALCDGHAVAHWVMMADRSGARLTVAADPDAPPHVHELLMKAKLPVLDRDSVIKGGAA
jgi:hypothetical protein